MKNQVVSDFSHYGKLLSHEDSVENAKIALKNVLYVKYSYYCLKEYLLELIEKDFNYECIIHYKDGKAVGVCLKTNFNQMMCYVKRKYRRQGIGTEMVTYFKDKNQNNKAQEGIPGSLIFWQKNNIYTF